jgi:hypothetical protein
MTIIKIVIVIIPITDLIFCLLSFFFLFTLCFILIIKLIFLMFDKYIDMIIRDYIYITIENVNLPDLKYKFKYFSNKI